MVEAALDTPFDTVVRRDTAEAERGDAVRQQVLEELLAIDDDVVAMNERRLLPHIEHPLLKGEHWHFHHRTIDRQLPAFGRFDAVNGELLGLFALLINASDMCIKGEQHTLAIK